MRFRRLGLRSLLTTLVVSVACSVATGCYVYHGALTVVGNATAVGSAPGHNRTFSDVDVQAIVRVVSVVVARHGLRVSPYKDVAKTSDGTHEDPYATVALFQSHDFEAAAVTLRVELRSDRSALRLLIRDMDHSVETEQVRSMRMEMETAITREFPDTAITFDPSRVGPNFFAG